MGIKTKLINVLAGIAVGGICLPTAFLTSCAVSQNNFVLVSKSIDVIESANQDVLIKLKYTGKDKIDLVKSIRFVDTLSQIFDFTSETENVPLDSNNELSFSIRLKNECKQIQNIKVGVILLYKQNHNRTFDIVDNIDIQCDAHDITLISMDPPTQTPNRYVEYKFNISGIVHPTQIDEVELLGEHVDKLELFQHSNIPVDENYNFSLLIRTKNITSPAIGDLDFQLQTTFQIFDLTITKNTSNCSVSYFYPNIEFAGQTSTYLVKQDQLVDFIFDVQIPSPEKVTKIDKVNVSFKDRLSSGNITLLNNTDIPVDNNNRITLTFKYDEIHQQGILDTTSFYFIFSFTTVSGIEIVNFQSGLCSLIAYTDVPYHGTKVQITPLQKCDVSIVNSTLDFQEGDYNIQYSIDGGEPQPYNTPEIDSEGQKISLDANKSIEFFNDTGKWSQSSGYFNFRFSAPVIIQGDITSLLDGVGGTITELSGSGIFNHLFYGANVLKVSSDLLRPTTLSSEAYQQMFASSNLIIAPELPATTVGKWCYQQMFSKCESLQIPPSILPIEYLPACVYDNMFMGCKALQYTPIIKAKNKDATSMKPSCAFRQCFYGCLSLKYIYIPDWETGWYDDEYTIFNEWVKDVDEKGVFYYNGDVIDERGISAIPENWIITEWHD